MLNRKVKLLAYILLPLLIGFIFNEYIIYHVVISRCTFPEIIHRSRGKSLRSNYSKIMMLADTHLLGIRNGHWFDKLRREWQMRRSFQTAIKWLYPDAVFFLGDNFDEGQWASNSEFDVYFNRFNELFHVPNDIKRYAVVGNHDAGFHYAMMPPHLERFAKKFGINESVDYVEINGNHFILLNSMAMEGDGCHFCHTAELSIKNLKKEFDCLLSGSCKSSFKSNYSRPIIMQHFPLYRESDEICEDSGDLAPEDIRKEKFRQKWECLSEGSTKFLLDSFRPRAVFGGHSHFTCSKWWNSPYNFYEYTIASFSWRNNRWPSFLLLTVSPSELKVSKCMLPHEHTVYFIYGLSCVCSLIMLIYQLFKKKNYQLTQCNDGRISPRRNDFSKIE